RWTADLTPAAGFEGAVVVEVPAGSYTDTAGNAGSGDSDTITVDTLAPSVTVALNDVNSTNVTATLITGTTAGVEPDQIVTLTITDGVNTVTTVATVEADGSYSITADLSALIDGTLTVTAVVSDLAGNSVTADALGVKAIADVPILGPIDDVFMLTPGATVISTGSVDKLVSPGAFDSGGGVRLSELEKELGLPDGFLDKRFDPSGPNVNDPGTVSVTDGKLTESHYAMTSGTTVHWDYVFTNGENLTYEVSGGFNDLVVLLVTDPLGNKQAILANASEAKFPASSISDSLDFTATMDGEYTFQWVLLNGGDRLKDSSLELGAAKFAVAGDSAAYGAPVRLPVFAGLADTDGSETLSVVVSGVPAGGRFTSGTDNGDGTWTFAASELGNLVFLPPAAFAGTISLGVSAIATESANGDAAVTQQTVTLTIDQSDSTFTQSGEAGQTINGTAGDDLIRGYAGNDTINAGAGDDLVYGGADNDTVRGGTGNDWLYGGQGADTLYGEAGNDVVIGGAGNDVLYGGAGADVFKWSLGDQGSTAAPAVDVVKDFTPSQGDVLDLRDLLIGEAHQGLEAGNLADYLSFDYVPGAGGATGTTVIAVKTLGADMSGPDQIIRLESVDLLGGVSDDQQIIQNLLASGKLITD
ncbi:MAG TPA: type I secretion C-terminal target domain-containing protein, partial [Thauera sp.]|nr:type I secretion C-terminal target domain-containing protein [Thauera sp.]